MGDYISREAVLKAFENADADVMEDYGDGTSDWGFGRGNIREILNSVPAADVAPVRRWIPCSERLPEVDDNYLCTFHFEAGNKNYASTLFFFATDPSPHFQCEDIRLLKVTHWMPLPEPPEEKP